ncbi:MAG: DUF1343 domain-containing protein [Bacteroidetes bacterium]|nr:DUF1343 domain-containing protein [Bacteroidota bacterium]
MGKSLIVLFQIISFSLFTQGLVQINNAEKTAADVKVGAQRFDIYLPLLKDKVIAIVSNQTSLVGNTHLLDTLLSLGVTVKKIFGPEHGFRGTADAGADVKTMKDIKTGIPVISLYGKKEKPSGSDLKGIDIVVFDIQDVGVRFYTYLSTLHYVMEACAENNKPVIVLDRPNPNGYYIDGPVLEDKYKSYVGLHPVPIVYGMTIGEYALMINGEKWLKHAVQCSLKVIPVEGYDHNDYYELPVKPSPNLPNMASVYLYPSLALFEGTVVSVGRGTETPFEVIGHPKLQNAKFQFTPHSIPGASVNPPYKDQLCYGFDLRNFGNLFIKNTKSLYLYWLQGTYKNTPDKATYFNNYFNTLAGTGTLKQQIIDGVDEITIRKSWEPGLKQFKEIRKKYLLYKDFAP